MRRRVFECPSFALPIGPQPASASSNAQRRNSFASTQIVASCAHVPARAHGAACRWLVTSGKDAQVVCNAVLLFRPQQEMPNYLGVHIRSAPRLFLQQNACNTARQFLQRIKNASIAVWNEYLQDFEDGGAAEHEKETNMTLGGGRQKRKGGRELRTHRSALEQ